MDWKQYEDEIFGHFRQEFPNAQITADGKVTGRYSKVERQVDVLVDDTLAGFALRIAIDAKHRGRPIDVVDVESFIGFCADVSANKGLMISLSGFTTAAVNRAHYDDSDIELDVLNFAELKQFQGFGAVPYAGKVGVLIPAPFGWVIDGTRREGAVATLYQRGRDLNEAGQAREWMYINFWTKDEKASSLEGLIEYQESHLRTKFPKADISYKDGPKRERDRTKVRRFVEESYPALEYTGFVEFDEFIFFCVLFTPAEFEKRNLRKLDYVLRSVLPIHVKQPSSAEAPRTDLPETDTFLK